MKRHVPMLAVTLLMVAGLTACLFRPRADPTKYYTLATADDVPVRLHSGRIVGLGPVSIPGYLGRPGLVTRVDATRIDYAELERWAEPLRRQFIRTLSEDLSLALGGAQVIDFPWRPGIPMDVAVRIDVRSFENDTAGTAMLTADWTLRAPASGATVSQGRSVITEPATGMGGAAAVAALGRTLARFAQELASAIDATQRPR